MTWSTRTALQCTGAVRTPMMPHAPIHPGRAPILVASCRIDPSPRAPAPDATVSRRRPRSRCCFVLAVFLAVPAALVGLASPAAADLGAPNRPSVPLLPSSRAHALPPDSTNVRVAMTENDGLDVIVASLSGVTAPGVSDSPAVRFQQSAGTWIVDTGPGCAGPWTPVAGRPDHPHGVGGRRRPPRVVRRRVQPDRARLADGALQLARSGEDRQHAPAGAVRGGHGARGVAVELGQPRWCRVPRAWTGASRSSRRKPSRSVPTCWPTSGATAATPTPVTSRARPTAAPSTRPRPPWPRPTTRPARSCSCPAARSPPPSTPRRRAATPRAPTSSRPSPPCPTTATRCASPAPATPTTIGRRPSATRPSRPRGPRSARSSGFPRRPRTPATPTTSGTGAWTPSPSRGARRRSPSPARSSTSTSGSTPISSPSPRPAAAVSPSPARGGATASGWASGARSGTPSARTTATATGPTRRS